MKQEFKELDVSKIQKVSFDTEIPVHNNHINTQRPLCTEFPQNKDIINKLEAIFNSEKITECSHDLFTGDYNTISNIEDLKKALSEILIRFDTNPEHYTKSDYATLMKLLYSTLLYLYKQFITISVNEKEIQPTEDNKVDIKIGTTDTEHIEVTTSDSGEVDIKAKIGEMNTPSNRIATINDIRNYITNKLSWQIYD